MGRCEFECEETRSQNVARYSKRKRGAVESGRFIKAAVEPKPHCCLRPVSYLGLTAPLRYLMTVFFVMPSFSATS